MTKKRQLTMLNHISIDSKVCHGQACIKGTRIPVHQILHMLANGYTVDELLEEYPTITRKDIFACIEYAAELTEEQIIPDEIVARGYLQMKISLR
ncbi:MAG: DUF433 domain-containing protein [Candidatus Schekmanbacteria bacterium]|nr:DUF433 domain-containing protein [Candidatus Schekmanbacteria bacterium]